MNGKTFHGASMAVGLALLTVFAGLTRSAHADQPAQPAGTIASQKVYYSDLKLDSPAGIERLYGRIKAAARNVCDLSVTDLEQVEQRVAWLTCFKSSVAAAVAQVNDARLTAMHLQAQSKRVG